MQRTAEEFVHQLPGREIDGGVYGRWFIGEWQGTEPETMYMLTDGSVARLSHLMTGKVKITTYVNKASAKRAAQAWLKKTLDMFKAEDNFERGFRIASGRRPRKPKPDACGFCVMGVLMAFDGPQIEITACDECKAIDNKTAVKLVEQGLRALAQVRALLWEPDGEPFEDTVHDMPAIRRALMFLKPTGAKEGR